MAEAARVVDIADRRGKQAPRSTDTRQKQQVATRIDQIPAAQMLCRIKHRWPMDEDLEVQPSGAIKLPKGVEVIPQADGTKRLREKCKRRGCPKHRSQETLPGGVYDAHAPYLYDSPQDWVVADASLGLSPRTAKGAIMGGRKL
jgi:hypothetical protein